MVHCEKRRSNYGSLASAGSSSNGKVYEYHAFRPGKQQVFDDGFGAVDAMPTCLWISILHLPGAT